MSEYVLRTAYEDCSDCGGSGMQDTMNGPDDCHTCRGDCVVRARDEHGRFVTRTLLVAISTSGGVS